MAVKTVTFYPEDVEALTRALQSLHSDRDTLDRWGHHSVDLTIEIERVESLRERMLGEASELRIRLASHPASLRVVS